MMMKMGPPLYASSSAAKVQQVQEYVFGYGSLICPISRTLTAPTLGKKFVTPVIVKNVERIWARNTYSGWTAMGVRFRDNAECIGVLLPVTPQELKQFDRREYGYTRVPIYLGDVEPTKTNTSTSAPPAANGITTTSSSSACCYCRKGHELFLQAKKQQCTTTTNNNNNNTTIAKVSIWMYLPEEFELPSQESPIVQSYVDTILRGCLSMGGEQFAEQFLKHTKGWNSSANEVMLLEDEEESKEEETKTSTDDAESNLVYWVNDRENPIYSRGDQQYMLQHAPKLDSLLEKYRSPEFKYRVNEQRQQQF